MNQTKPTHARVFIAIMLFICVVINYIDRANISIVAPLIKDDFGLNSIQLGYILSAFGWTYALLQIPGGWVLDRLGSRITYTISLFFWSLATLLQGMVKGFGTLFGLRLGLGAMESPAFPTNSRIVATWFPNHEHGSVVGFYTSGEFIGLAFLLPALVEIVGHFGWRSLFIITGIAGLIWSIIWYVAYRDPGKNQRVNQAELDYIRDGGGVVADEEGETEQKNGFRYLKYVLGSRKLWGIYIGQFAVTSTLWFFLTWFPTYLVDYRHVNYTKSGFIGSLPYLAAFVGVLFAGFMSDFLIKRGMTMSTARKIPIIAGLLLSTAIIGANYVDHTYLVVLFMSIAFFGDAAASITWVFVAELAPVKLLGLTGGVFNFIGNIASIAIPIGIGYLVKGGNFAPALIFIAAIALVGALSYIFLVGEVERIEIE